MYTKHTKKILFIFLLTIVFGGVFGSSVLANHIPGHPELAPENIPLGPQTGGELKTIFESIIDWIFVFFLILATIFIILAGFQFLTGGGDASKVAEARQKLLYAIIAIIVASFAKGMPVVVQSIVGAGGGGVANSAPTLIILDPDVDDNGTVQSSIDPLTNIMDPDLKLVADAFGKGNWQAPPYRVELDLRPNNFIEVNDITLVGLAHGLNWPPDNVKVGRSILFYLTATDPEGDSLTFSTSPLPLGASIGPTVVLANRTTTKFSWTPTITGNYNITFTVRDGTLTDSQSLSIVVIP